MKHTSYHYALNITVAILKSNLLDWYSLLINFRKSVNIKVTCIISKHFIIFIEISLDKRDISCKKNDNNFLNQTRFDDGHDRVDQTTNISITI